MAIKQASSIVHLAETLIDIGDDDETTIEEIAMEVRADDYFDIPEGDEEHDVSVAIKFSDLEMEKNGRTTYVF